MFRIPKHLSKEHKKRYAKARNRAILAIGLVVLVAVVAASFDGFSKESITDLWVVPVVLLIGNFIIRLIFDKKEDEFDGRKHK